MGHHVGELATYCEARISLGSIQRWDKRPSVYRPRRTPEQVAAVRMERALDGPLSVALMPGRSNTSSEYWKNTGWGRSPPRGYRGYGRMGPSRKGWMADSMQGTESGSGTGTP